MRRLDGTSSRLLHNSARESHITTNDSPHDRVLHLLAVMDDLRIREPQTTHPTGTQQRVAPTVPREIGVMLPPVHLNHEVRSQKEIHPAYAGKSDLLAERDSV